MEWVIEALRTLREVRDWAGRRANGGPKRALATHAALEEATHRVELVVAGSDEELVAPLGPASAPAIARSTPRARRRAAQKEADKAHEIPTDQIDPHALSTVRRLRKFGFKAYLVGGCVRDLLLGLTPKDFDVSTDARPEEIKRVFRNSRIIGRRFRLVHLYFKGGKIIEVATFRANLTPDDDDVEDGDDLLIRRDNVFGTEEEDALRRDFTINGLFYDPGSGRIIDHVGGLEDIRHRYLRMIGDPDIRVREDPVRILRAIRFTAKAHLRMDPDLQEALRTHTDDIRKCAPARVLEETLKLLRIGHAEETVRLMDELGVLAVLLPELKGYLDGYGIPEDAPEGALEARSQRLYAHLAALDALVHVGSVSDVVVLGALLYAPLEDYLDAASGQDRNRALAEFLASVGSHMALTRKLGEQLRQVLLAQRNMGRRGERPSRRRRRKKASPGAMMARPFFADALNLYEIHLRAEEEPLEEIEEWYQRVEEEVGGPVDRPLPTDALRPSRDDDDDRSPKRRRRRRRR